MLKKLRNALEASRTNAGDTGELKPFLEHLEDLRVMIIRSIASLAVGFGITFPFIPKIVTLLRVPLAPIEKTHPHLIRSGDNIAGGFNSAMQISFWGGLVLASPAIIYFIAKFVAPALTPREKNVIRQTSAVGFGLLIFGILLGWKYGLPAALLALIWFNDWMSVETWWTINNYISFTVLMLAAFGVVFEVPVVILILGRLGIISSDWLIKHWRHSLVVALIVAAIITPSPDIASQLLIAVPLYVLYLICIVLIRASEKKRKTTALVPRDPPA